MSRKLIDEFCWNDIKEQNVEKLTDSKKYKRIISWARKARKQNPNVFDALTEWMLDDSEWSDEKLAGNTQPHALCPPCQKPGLKPLPPR